MPTWMTEDKNFQKQLSKVICLEGYENLLIKFGVRYILSPNQARILLEKRGETKTQIIVITEIGNKLNYQKYYVK